MVVKNVPVRQDLDMNWRIKQIREYWKNKFAPAPVTLTIN